MKTLKLPPQRRFDVAKFHDVLALWQWFRARCVEIHGATELPERFDENDGTLSQHSSVDDWMAPAAEYNYDWRTQDLTWRTDRTLVAFTRNQDTHLDYVRFRVSDLDSDGRVCATFKVRLSTFQHGEATLDGPDETVARWEHALEALTPTA